MIFMQKNKKKKKITLDWLKFELIDFSGENIENLAIKAMKGWKFTLFTTKY